MFDFYMKSLKTEEKILVSDWDSLSNSRFKNQNIPFKLRKFSLSTFFICVRVWVFAIREHVL